MNTIFFVLFITWVSGDGAYSKAIPFTNLNACQEAGAKVPTNGVWRCMVETIAVDGNTVHVHFE